MHTAERYHDISCGHRVHGHESKCAHLHGHNYRVHFVCIPEREPPKLRRRPIGQPDMINSELDELGRVVDFSVIKSTLCEWLEENWDHKFLVWEQDPAWPHLFALDPHGVVKVPFNPTAENMAHYLVTYIGPQLLSQHGVTLLSCRVDETRKCSASYSAAVQP